MELKFVVLLVARTAKNGSNRTFMELKSFIFTKNIGNVIVLIVPLWN